MRSGPIGPMRVPATHSLGSIAGRRGPGCSGSPRSSAAFRARQEEPWKTLKTTALIPPELSCAILCATALLATIWRRSVARRVHQGLVELLTRPTAFYFRREAVFLLYL